MSTEKNVKENPSHIIVHEDGKFVVKDFSSIQANMLSPTTSVDVAPIDVTADAVFYTKEEVDRMMGCVYNCMCDYLNEIYSCVVSGDKSIAMQVNEYIGHHNGGHLPHFHPGQIKAILETCGIAEDFESPKPPMVQNDPHQVYASFDVIKEKMKDIKFKIN